MVPCFDTLRRSVRSGEAGKLDVRAAFLVSLLLLAIVGGVFAVGRYRTPSAEKILTASRKPVGSLTISYPQNGTLFPPEIVAPTFVWEDKTAGVDRWLLAVDFESEGERLTFASDEPEWRPSEDDWRQIKRRSLEADAEVAIIGVDRSVPGRVLSSARLRIRTSKDEVGDSLFYREVPLPFLDAVRDPSRIRWRLGSVDSQTTPPIVLHDLPVCGNCHSFSADGSLLGLDVDYGNDKGAYAIIPVEKQMVMNDSKIITWADFRKEDNDLTFGLLSRVSPDGRYVVSTVKDRSVFVAIPDIMFSQLFFPIKGILVVYDRQTKTFQALPGADDPQYVQTNPVWSPDGKTIVFARAKAYRLDDVANKDSVLLDETDVPEFIREKKPFRYDLYAIPFNGGKGGVAKPLTGASKNGKSNFFPKFSRDGKWIVFCKANSYMLLQPDSELYIVPADGGEARRLRYNTARMNSWHTWSSNSRWLAFSSKVNRPYTQLFLTHIDEDGNDSPPVLLERFTVDDRAANIPEFVPLPADAIAQIREEFLDAYSFWRAGLANERTGDHEGAIRAYRRGLEIEPDNIELHNALGWALFQVGRSEEAVAEYERALAINPDYVKAHNNLALALIELGRLDDAATHYRRSLELEPKAEIYSDLGFILDRQGNTRQAVSYYRKALELDPGSPQAHFNLAGALLREEELDEAAEQYRAAIKATPSAAAYNGLGVVRLLQGRLSDAVEQFRGAIKSDPDFVPAYNNLADSLARQGELEEAASIYRNSLAHKPSAKVHNRLGMLLANLGHRDEARREFEEAVKLKPEFAEARRNLAALDAN